MRRDVRIVLVGDGEHIVADPLFWLVLQRAFLQKV